MKKLWDISPPIAPDSPLFPGDTAYSQQWTATIAPGCPVNLSAITMSPHIGAHADAPLHYGERAPTIGQVDHIVMGARSSGSLRRYLGSVSARVVAESDSTVTVVRAPAPGD